MKSRLILAWSAIAVAAIAVITSFFYIGYQYQAQTENQESADISSAVTDIKGCSVTIQLDNLTNDAVNQSVLLRAFTQEGEQTKLGFFDEKNQLTFTVLGNPAENQEWNLRTINKNNEIVQEDYLAQPLCNQNYYLTIE